MNPVLKKFTDYIGREDRPEDPEFSRWLGGVFREVKEGELVMDFRVRTDMTNPVGYLHGGAQNAIVDDVIGMTVLTLGHRQFFMSLGLHVDYLGRCKVGETVSALGKVVRSGKNVVHAQCELLDSQNTLICRGTSNLMRSPFPAMPEIHRGGR
ncbi:MAG: PaaI family thioesterase [Deltaproteobacteria bacterium]|nr:PaaI family thioesterase [Deltaproteobacteria bacterium]